MDARDEQRFTALCYAATKRHKEATNVLLEEYQARGRLHEALDKTSMDEDGTPRSILWHVGWDPTSAAGDAVSASGDGESTHLSLLRELVSRWGVDIRRPFYYQGLNALPLHLTAAYGNLPLCKYFIEECGLSVDEFTIPKHNTPLSFACHVGGIEYEERQLPVIKYLLEKGADVTHRNADGKTPQQLTFKINRKIYGLLGRAVCC